MPACAERVRVDVSCHRGWRTEVESTLYERPPLRGDAESSCGTAWNPTSLSRGRQQFKQWRSRRTVVEMTCPQVTLMVPRSGS